MSYHKRNTSNGSESFCPQKNHSRFLRQNLKVNSFCKKSSVSESGNYLSNATRNSIRKLLYRNNKKKKSSNRATTGFNSGKFSQTFQSSGTRKMFEKQERLKKSLTPLKIKTEFLKKCKRCRNLGEEKDELKEENENLKDIQKILMKRLKQQDKYIEQCLFKKQEEIDGLLKEVETYREKCIFYENKTEKLENEITVLIKHMQNKREADGGGMYLDLNFTLNGGNVQMMSGNQNKENFKKSDEVNRIIKNNSANAFGFKRRSDPVLQKLANREIVVIQEESESEEDLDYIASLNAKSEENFIGEDEIGEKKVKLKRCKSDSIGQQTDRSERSRGGEWKRGNVVFGLKPEVVQLLSKFNEVDLAQLTSEAGKE